MSIINKPDFVLAWTSDNINQAPKTIGVYVLRNIPPESGIIYIGRTENLKRRLLEHHRLSDIPEVSFFDWYATDTEQSAINHEKLWIQKYSPKHNERIG